MEFKRKSSSIEEQVKKHSQKEVVKNKNEYDGNIGTVISTGSTLLDLEISGARIRGGGIPGGILVEIFGPSGSGKTVLLCEIGGMVQRAGGDLMFRDPEARLNKQFAQMFDLDTSTMKYDCPDTITEVFESVREWEPKTKGMIHGVMTDSLAALSTEAEMEDKDGMGMRRAKEFSQECRKTCRILTKKNFLMVCSNQIRQNSDAGPYAEKYKSPGGEAIPFYASLRLKTSKGQKIKEKKKIAGKEVTKVVGVETEIEIYKSSVGRPYGKAPVCILFDYGIDDIRTNLQYIKTNTGAAQYVLDEEPIGKSIQEAINFIEENELQKQLKNEVIDLWEEIEKKFKIERKPKIRTYPI